jgi:hypothetical protein
MSKPIRIRLTLASEDPSARVYFNNVARLGERAAARVGAAFSSVFAQIARNPMMMGKLGAMGGAAGAALRNVVGRMGGGGGRGGWPTGWQRWGSPAGGGPFGNLAASAVHAGRVGGAGLGGITSALTAIPRAARSASQSMLGIVSTIWLVERGLRMLKAVTITPFEGLLGATEESRKFEYSMASVLGTMEKARKLNRELVRSSKDLPGGISDLRSSAEALAFNPALSSRLTYAKSTEAARQQVLTYQSLVQRLGVADPQQGAHGAGLALRNVFEGGDDTFRSLRIRFGLSGRVLARQVAKEMQQSIDETLEQMKNDPSVAYRGVERYIDAMIPPEAAARMSKLVSVRMQKLRETFRAGLAQVGDSGVFDDTVSMLEKFGGSLFEHLDSPQFRAQAQRASNSLSTILRNLSRMVVEMLAQFTGTKGGTDTVAGVVEVGTRALEKLASASEGLPALGKNVATFIQGLDRTVGSALGKVEELIAAITGFSLTQNILDPNLFANLGDGGKELSQRRANAALKVAQQFGIEGGSVRKMGLRQAPNMDDPTEALPYLWQEYGHALWQQLKAGDFMNSSGRDYYAEGRDYALGKTYGVEAGGVKDIRQRQLLAQVASALDNLTDAQLQPGRANVEVLNTLKAAKTQDGVSLLERLQGLRGGGPTTRPTTQPAGSSFVSLEAPLVRKLIKDEYTGANFAAMVQPIGQLLGQIESLVPQTEIEKATRKGRGVFSTNLSGDVKDPLFVSGVFGRLKQAYGESAEVLDAAIKQGTAQLAKQFDPEVAGWVEHLKKNRLGVGQRYDLAVQTVEDHLVTGAQDFARFVEGGLSDLPPEVAVGIREKLVTGATSFADSVAETLRKAGREVPDRRLLGLGKQPLSQRLRGMRDDFGRRAQALEDATRLGIITDRFGGALPDLTAKQIVNLRPLYERDARRRLAQLYEMKAIPEQSGVFNEARRAYLANPNELTTANLGIAGHDLADLAHKLRAVRRELDFAGEGFRAFAEDTRLSLDNTLGEVLTRILERTGDVGDAFRALAHDVLASFSRMSTNNLLNALIGDAGRRDREGNQAPLGGILGSILNPIFGGGSTPGYATGGIVSGRRTITVGEKGPEAIIPMSGRRKIDVQLMGGRHTPASAIYGSGASRGQGTHVHVYQHETKADAIAAARRQQNGLTPGDVAVIAKAAVKKDIQSGGDIRKMLGR